MQVLFFILILLSSFTCFSQKIVNVGKENLPNTSGLFYAVGGVPISNAKYVRVVDGSPFYMEAWSRGKLVLSEGTSYENVPLRLDLMDNSVHYIAPNGDELIATSPIRTITVRDSLIGKIIQFDNSAFMSNSGKADAGWYQLLDSGKVLLYKRYKKSIRENKPYGSATYEQTIETSVNYYVLINGLLTPVKKFQQLPELLSDKTTELKTFLNLKNLAGRSDADHIKLVQYYNSLK
jgi:hypothetical protein